MKLITLLTPSILAIPLILQPQTALGQDVSSSDAVDIVDTVQTYVDIPDGAYTHTVTNSSPTIKDSVYSAIEVDGVKPLDNHPDLNPWHDTGNTYWAGPGNTQYTGAIVDVRTRVLTGQQLRDMGAIAFTTPHGIEVMTPQGMTVKNSVSIADMLADCVKGPLGVCAEFASGVEIATALSNPVLAVEFAAEYGLEVVIVETGAMAIAIPASINLVLGGSTVLLSVGAITESYSLQNNIAQYNALMATTPLTTMSPSNIPIDDLSSAIDTLNSLSQGQFPPDSDVDALALVEAIMGIDPNISFATEIEIIYDQIDENQALEGSATTDDY